MGYKIGSFNLYKFNYESSQEIKKSFETLAKIIKNNKFDIVALQEVVSESALKQGLMQYLPGWDCSWEAPRYMTQSKYKDRFVTELADGVRVKGFSKSKNEAEGYAFIWNTKTVALHHKEKNGYKYLVEPRIYNQYRVDYERGQLPLARNPYYGRFIPAENKNDKFPAYEMRLINTHITYGQTGNSHHRIKELEIIFDQIYKRVSSDEAPPYPVYTIILGDYNLNLKRSYTKSPYLELRRVGNTCLSMEYYEICEEQVNYKTNNKEKKVIKTIKTVQESLSTLRQPNRENFSPENGLANNYDHFTYEVRYEKEKRTSKANAVYGAIDKYYRTSDGKRDYQRYKKEISDHIPVEMTLNI